MSDINFSQQAAITLHDKPLREPIPKNMEAMYASLAIGKDNHLLYEETDFDDAELIMLSGCQTVEGHDADIEENGLMLAAISTKFSPARLDRTVKAFAKKLGGALNGTGLETAGVVIGKPRVAGGFATLVTQIKLSDGQAISMLFHAPDEDPAKFDNDDTLYAFMFKLNAKDVTNVVAPSGGMDISIGQATMVLSNLAEKNSAPFTARKAASTEKKLEAEKLEVELEELKIQAATLAEEAEKKEGIKAELTSKLTTRKGMSANQDGKIKALNAEITLATPAPKKEEPKADDKRTVKGLDKDIYDFVINADKEQLFKMQRELSSDIDKGILTDPKYQIELNLINSRLEGVIEDTPASDELSPEQAKAEFDANANDAATSPENDLPEPTEAQKEAGDYKKGKAVFQDIDVKIENPKGSTRSGENKATGEKWETTMKSHYGEIIGTKGADGDELDIFVGENHDAENAYIVDQVNQDGSFDEHKIMLGFNNKADAKKGYEVNYDKDWQGLGNITEIAMTDLKKWIKGNSTKPYKAISGGGSTVEAKIEEKEQAEAAEVAPASEPSVNEQAKDIADKGFNATNYQDIRANEELELALQDQLDSFFSRRLYEVVNHLLDSGWNKLGDDFVKGDTVLTKELRNIGNGGNVSAVSYDLASRETNSTYEDFYGVKDDLTLTTEEIANKLNNFAKSVADDVIDEKVSAKAMADLESDLEPLINSMLDELTEASPASRLKLSDEFKRKLYDYSKSVSDIPFNTVDKERSLFIGYAAQSLFLDTALNDLQNGGFIPVDVNLKDLQDREVKPKTLEDYLQGGGENEYNTQNAYQNTLKLAKEFGIETRTYLGEDFEGTYDEVVKIDLTKDDKKATMQIISGDAKAAMFVDGVRVGQFGQYGFFEIYSNDSGTRRERMEAFSLWASPEEAATPAKPEASPTNDAYRKLEQLNRSLVRDMASSLSTIKGIDNGTEQGYERSLFVNSITGKIKTQHRQGNQETVDAALDYVEAFQSEKMTKPAITSRNGVWKLRSFDEPEVEVEQVDDVEPSTTIDEGFDMTEATEQAVSLNRKIMSDNPSVTQIHAVTVDVRNFLNGQSIPNEDLINKLDAHIDSGATGDDVKADINAALNELGGDDQSTELTNRVQALIDKPPTDSDEFDQALDVLASDIEDAGLMEVLEPKLSEAADRLSELLELEDE